MIPQPRKRKDFKDIVQLTSEELVGVRFRFSYGGGMGCKPYVVSYDGLKEDGTDGLMVNFRFGTKQDGTTDRATIIVPIDQQCLTSGSGDTVRVRREFWIPDTDFADGYNYQPSDEHVHIPNEGPASYSQVVINCMRGERGADGQITEAQKTEIINALKTQITAQSLGITLASLGLEIDINNKLLKYGGKQYQLTEYVYVTSTEYSTPTISLTYSDIAAAGGSVSPRLTYSQQKTTHYSDGTQQTETIGGSGTVTYSDPDGAMIVNGNVTAAASTNTTRHKVQTVTVTVLMNGKEATKTADVYQAAYVAPATAYDYYIGQVQSNASGFTALTADQITAAVTKQSINANKTASYQATKSCVVMLVPTSHQHLSLTKFQYTSGGMTTNVLADNMWNLTHADVEIDGVTYKVYGYRSGGITESDPLTFDYQITYTK